MTFDSILKEQLDAEDEIDVLPDIQRIEQELQSTSTPTSDQLMAYSYCLVRSGQSSMQSKGISILMNLCAQEPCNQHFLYYLALSQYRLHQLEQMEISIDKLAELEQSEHHQQTHQSHRIARSEQLRSLRLSGERDASSMTMSVDPIDAAVVSVSLLSVAAVSLIAIAALRSNSS